MIVKAVIQARMSSSRLPGKVLLPLGTKPVLAHVFDRLEKCRLLDDIVLATSTDESDDVLERFCADYGVACFRGGLDDVLGRFYATTQVFECDHIVRITADCPLIDPSVVDAVVLGHLAGGYDYYGLAGEFPDGLDCTAISASVLSWAHENATLPSDREHIGPFIERSRERRWKKGELRLFAGMQDIRLTLDEVDDYEFLRHILEQAFKVDDPPTASVLNYVRANPDIQGINSHISRNQGYEISLSKDDFITSNTGGEK